MVMCSHAGKFGFMLKLPSKRVEEYKMLFVSIKSVKNKVGKIAFLMKTVKQEKL